MDKCICGVHENEVKRIAEGAWVDLYINKEAEDYLIEAISSGRASLKINFCPICGRKLAED